MQIFNTEERNRNMENHKVERSEIPNTFGFERPGKIKEMISPN